MGRPRGFLLHPPALRALLDAKGLTQRDIAQRSGMSVQTVSALYRRDSRASASTAQAVAAAVGCDAEALFPEIGGQWSPIELSAPAVA